MNHSGDFDLVSQQRGSLYILGVWHAMNRSQERHVSLSRGCHELCHDKLFHEFLSIVWAGTQGDACKLCSSIDELDQDVSSSM